VKAKTLRRFAAGAVALGVLVAACVGAAHVRLLQPPTPPRSLPSSPPLPPAAGRPAMQLGVDIDLSTRPGQNVPAAAAADVAYVKSLHANAISVSFPFFVRGGNGGAPVVVYASPVTPTPAQLAIVARAAERAGLYVTIRPLLGESGIGESRTQWRPTTPKVWFASYLRFLRPYAAMAQHAHIGGLFVGAELTQFGSSPRWRRLDAALARVYKGTLLYAANWGSIQAHPGGKIQVTIDAYPPRPGLPASAGQAQVTRAWMRYDRSLPAGVVESEVGIDAVAGAYAIPYFHHWPAARLDPLIQVRWFTAACRAAIAEHLGGIYFWSIGFRTHLSGPTLMSQGAWAHSPAAQAISACYAHAAQGNR
jgi:glycosyl hydrolase family 113